MIKKTFRIVLTLLVLFNFVYIPDVSAKTVADLQKDLDKKEQELKNQQDSIKYTDKQIANTKANINQAYINIGNIQNDMITKTKEIEQLNIEIANKDKEAKELIAFSQLSQGSSEYMEYIAGAETLTDFIYRIAITDQLLDYNNELINTMNQNIVANEQKKKELAAKEVELKNTQVVLSKQLNELGNKRDELDDYARSMEDEIKTAREVLKAYKESCKPNEDIDVCAKRILPPDTSFWRPIVSGYVTSEYGLRDTYVNGINVTKKNGVPQSLHAAIDLSNSNPYNTKLYAAAAGKVAAIFYDGGGGNQVVIHHNIIENGKSVKYTTYYCHLSSISVKEKQIVSKDTVVGYMGSTGNSSGPHLHFGMANGHWFTDYNYYSGYKAHSFNPRIKINFPTAHRSLFINRITKYN